MKKNKVSLIIPVYNSALYIEKCLESIVNQTYKNIEVIAIDDGSKDQSLKLLKRYAKKYNYFKVYSQKNLGVAKTRNKAVSLATGDYIMFVDNDDFLEKDYIERYITEILETKSDILIGGYQRVNSKNKVLFYAMPKNTSWGKYIVVAPWAKKARASRSRFRPASSTMSSLGKNIQKTSTIRKSSGIFKLSHWRRCLFFFKFILKKY